MANKKVILSNGDGRITFTDPTTISIDDTTDNLNIKHLSSSADIQINSLPSGVQLLSASAGGVIGTVPVSATVGGALLWNGTQWSGSSTLLQQCSGSAGGDLSGTYPSPQVVSVANVNSGALPVKNGGTGLSVSEGNKSSKVVLKVSGSVNPVISGITGSSSNSGSVLTNVEGSWKLAPPAYVPDVRFYTYNGVTNTFTWTKPAGARLARVILQGAGGGGGGGQGSPYVGAGGGSGGFTDIIIDVSGLNFATVTIGLGGDGGGVAANGVVGGATSFNYQYYSYGGGGGGRGQSSGGTTNGGYGGYGYTKSGVAGAATSTTNGATAYDVPSGGSRGGAAVQGAIVNLANSGNKNFGYLTTSDGLDISTLLIVAQGSIGGSSGSPPSRPGYGAGGGGGYLNAAGGPGGHGYALIISW